MLHSLCIALRQQKEAINTGKQIGIRSTAQPAFTGFARIEQKSITNSKAGISNMYEGFLKKKNHIRQRFAWGLGGWQGTITSMVVELAPEQLEQNQKF